MTDRSQAPAAGGAPRQRLVAVAHGRVQGVGFRVHVRREARALGLAGWVANEPGGSVRTIAEGPPEALDRLEAVLREGPRGAWVERLVAERGPATGEFDGFDVRSGWHSGD